jgi:hypothetical protein
MAYFDKIENQKSFIKILVGIIVSLILLNLLIVKSLINIAENKNIRIQVPQFMESGEYIIGNTFANENVYKMWVKVWIEDIATFSYKNIAKKYEDLYPFLDPQTAFKSKSEMLKFISFVENNFISQKFKLKNIEVTNLKGGYVKVTAFGTIKREIGNKKDSLNGMRYSYEFICYVRNGQIYINSITSSFYGLVDLKSKDKLRSNKFVNFDEVIQ